MPASFVGVERRRMTLHFMDSFISFHSCKVDPHWYGVRTSNPWENERSAVRFRLLYVRQTNISTRVRMNVQCQQRQLQQQQWLILFIVFSISWNNSSGLFFVSIHVRLIIIGVGHRLQICERVDTSRFDSAQFAFSKPTSARNLFQQLNIYPKKQKRWDQYTVHVSFSSKTLIEPE